MQIILLRKPEKYSSENDNHNKRNIYHSIIIDLEISLSYVLLLYTFIFELRVECVLERIDQLNLIHN